MSETASSSASTSPPQRIKSKWNATRTTGHLFLGFWILAGLGLVWFMIISYDHEFNSKYALKFINGFFVTITLVIVSLLIGALISLPMTAMRMSNYAILRGIAYCYVYFFRGTPLLAQAFLVYYGAGSFRPFFQDIGLWWFFRDAWYCAVFAFSLNTSAYQTEILRGAIQSIPRGQWEAAKSMGISNIITFLRVILPQALITALRPYGNEIILMIKGSAIASIITVFDIMGEVRRAYSRSYDFQAYIWAAIMYLILVESLRRLWERFEQRLTKHLSFSH